ncbi:MAG: hypothetical protein GVY36_13620 [Verrucomicrobia bacterium]|jgi:hypothetical protein|nr:hypothetical protein [Verrucomicrobiota bacterium]
MIHVQEKPEPASFDAQVRQPGLTWLNKESIDLDQPVPPKTEIKACWRACLDDLYRSYDGYCAYLAVFFERTTGVGTVDHFVAKSKRADQAYEWKNYRLACSRMNSRKRDYEDVIDPFHVLEGDFYLELISGRIFANPGLVDERKSKINDSIVRLGLDDVWNREMRARYYQEYRQGYYNEDFLKRRSPFVWKEANRQGLL